MALTQVDQGLLSPIAQYTGFKNRIINGAMMIDQRNAGASVGTASGSTVYTTDRWQAVYSQTSKFTIQQNAGSVTPPAGYTNYVGITSSSAYSITSTDFFVFRQAIEGLNLSDLGWGTASAQTITVSFWIRSSLTGTLGAVIMNSAANRSYPFTYTISSANTWEYKTVTIAGDTSGTWLTTNGVGLYLQFGLGVGSTYSGTAGAWTGTANIFAATGATSVVGTNGATFYITGVQLEKGSTATSFDYRPYGTELSLCQRYFALAPIVGACIANGTTAVDFPVYYPVQMRADATVSARSVITISDSVSADYPQSSANISATFSIKSTSAYMRFNNFTGLTSGKTYLSRLGDMFINVSAEL